ncbi:MAG: hypothetical protein IJU58_00970 [Clostridia bacterium]|nr:hypothetical protein [Clostridia bacterium]
MEKEYVQKIIQKFKTGLNKIDILMRKLTACDEEVLGKQTKPLQSYAQLLESQTQDLRESLSPDVADNIQDRVRTAITPGFSELSMFIISDDPKGIDNLRTAFKQTRTKLLQVPDDIDKKYQDKNLNFKDIKAYTGLAIREQTQTNTLACEQLLDQEHIKQQYNYAKQSDNLIRKIKA